MEVDDDYGVVYVVLIDFNGKEAKKRLLVGYRLEVKCGRATESSD